MLRKRKRTRGACLFSAERSGDRRRRGKGGQASTFWARALITAAGALLLLPLARAGGESGPRLGAAGGPADTYFAELAVYHEDMHAEALLMSLQTLALAAPDAGVSTGRMPPSSGSLPRLANTETCRSV